MFESKDAKYPLIYRGKVLDNNDPEKLGRCKVEVIPYMVGIPSELLPWSVPAFGVFEGAGDNIGSFTVPDVGTFVFVFFEMGDPYQPVFFAEAQTALFGLPASRLVNYPNRKVWRTNIGIELYIDDTAHELKITHPAGTTILIDVEGNVIMNVAKDTRMTVQNDVKIEAMRDISVIAHRDIGVHAMGNMSVVVDGQSYMTINADTSITCHGKVDLKSDKTVDVQSSQPMTLRGSTINLNP